MDSPAFRFFPRYILERSQNTKTTPIRDTALGVGKIKVYPLFISRKAKRNLKYMGWGATMTHGDHQSYYSANERSI